MRSMRREMKRLGLPERDLASFFVLTRLAVKLASIAAAEADVISYATVCAKGAAMKEVMVRQQTMVAWVRWDLGCVLMR